MNRKKLRLIRATQLYAPKPLLCSPFIHAAKIGSYTLFVNSKGTPAYGKAGELNAGKIV